MPTIRDLSKFCGVSVSTVSKALNDHTDVSPATKLRVRQAAKQLGYYPNAMAQALKTSRTGNLGIVYEDAQNDGLSHNYFASILNSCKQAAERHGYDLTFLSNSFRNLSYLEHSKYRGVDGILVVCCDYSSPQIRELVDGNIPAVTIDYTFHNRTSIVSDNTDGMRQLVRYICGMGHTRIAYIHGEDDGSNAVTRQRMAGFRAALEEHGLAPHPAYVVPGAYRDTRRCAALTRQLLALDTPPTCILYPDDYAALGGINELGEQGIPVAGPVSIAGYDGIQLARVLEPNLTTFAQDTCRIGRLAAENLIQCIEHPGEASIKKVVVKGELAKGASVARL